MASQDFDAMIEDDSWLQDSPRHLSEPVSKPHKKRAKAMNIDDLLKDHFQDKSKKLVRETKRMRSYVSDSEGSDYEEAEEKTHKEVQFEELVECCEKQVHAGGATLDILKWGERLFCGQTLKETSVCLPMDSLVVQALLVAKEQVTYNSDESKDDRMAEALVEELLASGWFLSFESKLDARMMHWILDKMTFTTDTVTQKAACNVLCHTLESENVDYSWIPSYSEILNVFKGYGYSRPEVSNNEILQGPLDSKGHPPDNLGSFLRFLTFCLKKRHMHHCLPREDVEKLVVLIASLSLDRSLLSLGTLIQGCLSSLLNSLTDDEWHNSCESIAISMAKFNRHAVNYLKLTRSLNSREARMKCLQSKVALALFSKMASKRTVVGLWDMLAVFRESDVKKSTVDFVSLYFQMSMADIWLWSNPDLKAERGAVEAWLHFLKSCSFQISSTDWRPYATKVRNHASYLLQVYQCYYQDDDYEEA